MLLIKFKFDEIILVNDLSFIVTDVGFCCNLEQFFVGFDDSCGFRFVLVISDSVR